MGAATVTEMTLVNGEVMQPYRPVAGTDLEVILQITPADAAGGGYATGGDTIDLTGYFPEHVFGAELLSCIDAPTAGLKWEINVDPTATTGALTTTIQCFNTMDPADTGIQNIEFQEIAAATDLSAFPTTWRFRGR